MIVEDDPRYARDARAFPAARRFDVRTPPTASSRSRRCRRDSRLCVILLDLMMPVMNGWQFREAQVRRSAASRIPVVVVTAAGPRSGYPADRRRRLAVEAGRLRAAARRPSTRSFADVTGPSEDLNLRRRRPAARSRHAADLRAQRLRLQARGEGAVAGHRSLGRGSSR